MANKTFICQACGHELPISYQHEEKPEVCFLDYVSEKDRKRIGQIIEEKSDEG